MSELPFLERSLLNPNIQAFLQMISKSEGTFDAGGYAAMFGSTPSKPLLFTDYTDHPRKRFSFKDSTGKVNYTDASGKYQILSRWWDPVKVKLGLPDFSPHSQDLWAVNKLSELNCVKLIMDGHFHEALKRAASGWASLPGAGYNQRENKVQACEEWYKLSGGVVVD